MAKLKEEEIIDRWSVLIEGANGRGKELFKKVDENLKEIKAPKVEILLKEVSPSLMRKIRGEKRTFLVVQNTYLKSYLMYIGAADYGKQLFVSWYLTMEPSAFQKFLSKLPWFIAILLLPIIIMVRIYNLFKKKTVSPAEMDLFDLEELTAYVTTVHHALMDEAKEISESVGFDFSKVDQKSRGFLNIS
ncbi:hypothetical protein ES703_12941 [subsurface metagenome]